MPKRKAPTRVRRSFTPEFKRDAVRPVEEGKTLTEVAQNLGIARSLLQYWKKQLDQDKAEAFPGKRTRRSAAMEARPVEHQKSICSTAKKDSGADRGRLASCSSQLGCRSPGGGSPNLQNEACQSLLLGCWPASECHELVLQRNDEVRA